MTTQPHPLAGAVKPHDYQPDPMMMGDCSVCGNTREAHDRIETPTPPADVAGLVERLRFCARIHPQFGYPENGKLFHEAAEALTALSARVAELDAALDSAEVEHGITSNGNLWRFWSRQAQEMAAKLTECRKRAEAAEVALAGARGDVDVEYLAFRLWRHEAERAAPNVAKQRTLKSFADQSPETTKIWMGFANAAIRAMKGT